MKSTGYSLKSTRRKNRTVAKREKAQPRETLNVVEKEEIIKKLKNIQKNRFKCLFQQFKGVTPYFSIQQNQLLAQEWTTKNSNGEKSSGETLTYQSFTHMLLAFVMMLSFTFTIWQANLDFFFSLKKQPSIPHIYYIIPIFFLLADLVISGVAKTITNETKLKNVVKLAYKPAFCIVYLMLKAIHLQISHEIYWLILEVPCLIYLYHRASQFYQAFRVMTLSKYYEYHVKSFDLIFSLAILAHFIVYMHVLQAIILYNLTLFEKGVTWMSDLPLDRSSPLILYIYSFYFGCTTILTVGYGDIVPSNHVQIAVVCFIELFGIAIFAYLISEIGYNLSNLRKDRQVLEKDLSILEKCKGYYKIRPQLMSKTRSNILNCQQAINRLKPEQQKMLISKLSQPLREEIVAFNNLSIIKSCIFFLCRWSKNFQLSLSKQLVSSLYMPGETFFQPEGKQRIYIIRLGKVDIYRKGKGSKRQTQKVIRSIKMDLQTEVSNNSFGYTALIGRRPTELQAISSDFTSTYYVDRQTFLKSMVLNSTDEEYYFQIRDRIDQSTNSEALEVPVLQSRKYHYSPIRHLLIKHHCNSIGELRNSRTEYIRSQFRHLRENMIFPALHKHQAVDKVQKAFITSIDEITLREERQRNEEQLSISTESEMQKIKTRQMVNQYKNHHSTLKHFVVKQKEFSELSKEFKNYHPSHNLQNVLKRYDLTLINPQKNSQFQAHEVLMQVQKEFYTFS